MKKIFFTLIILAGLTTNLFAQKKEKEIKYKKVFYKSQTIENADVKITIDDAVATPFGIKFKLSIINKSIDYIIFKPSECVFKIKGQETKPEEKWLTIKPNDHDSRVIDLKGGQYMQPENFNFILDGLYKVTADSKGTTAPDFKLPPAQNDFKAGNFSVKMDKLKKETARTDAKFIVTYSGDNFGIFEPNKVAMKMPDGKEYANYRSDNEPVLFDKGKVDDFTVAWKDIPTTSGDMQKAEMIILWRDAFKDVVPVKIPTLDLIILFDKDLSYEKGR
ncbi:MAG: hypothetical protein ACXVPU_17115 [Bacteroidia bacterium]